MCLEVSVWPMFLRTQFIHLFSENKIFVSIKCEYFLNVYIFCVIFVAVPFNYPFHLEWIMASFFMYLFCLTYKISLLNH